jgi:hypothetical protein
MYRKTKFTKHYFNERTRQNLKLLIRALGGGLAKFRGYDFFYGMILFYFIFLNIYK